MDIKPLTEYIKAIEKELAAGTGEDTERCPRVGEAGADFAAKEGA
jgi:hypothetical protein